MIHKRIIGLVCPTVEEYNACVDVLGLTPDINTHFLKDISTGTLGKSKVIAINSGPGKIQSASSTQYLISTFKPDLVLDVGASGSLTNELNIYDIVCGVKIFESDICSLEEFSRYADELTSETHIAHESYGDIKKDIEDISNQLKVTVKFGNIIGGEKTIKDREDRNRYNEAFNAIACNWESSAIIKTAYFNGVDCLSFRVISDNADGDMRENYVNNLNKALNTLFTFVYSLLSDKE